jgi:hypothetical protein
VNRQVLQYACINRKHRFIHVTFILRAHLAASDLDMKLFGDFSKS